MSVMLTSPEREALNKVFPLFPDSIDFVFELIYVEKIFKPSFTDAEGLLDLGAMAAARAEFKTKVSFDNISKYLIEKGYAVLHSTWKNQMKLVLSELGIVLKAFGGEGQYFFAINKISEQNIIDNIMKIIELAPPYGEFLVRYAPPPPIITSITLSETNGKTGEKKYTMNSIQRIKQR